MRSRPIGIDLFAGAGGMSLGFEQAGFDVRAAVEIDPIHCAVHRFNFPRTAVVPLPVETLSGNDVRDLAGLGDTVIDCVFGGPPCQGFSLIGHRALDDPRNGLVRDFVRLVSELNARTFVFENVKGLTSGRQKGVLGEIVTAFGEAGYRVRSPWRVLNAGHYGTPQFRERLFLFGARKGEAVPEYPGPLTEIAGSPRRLGGLAEGPTCSDAIGDLPDADAYPGLTHSDELANASFGKPSPYAAGLRGIAADSWHSGHIRRWNRKNMTSSARTAHTAISRRRFAGTPPGKTEPISRFYRLSPNGVSNTLRAGTDGKRGAFTSPRPIHYKHPRCITVREMARLHGFPDWFRFHATKWHGARQVGNAVPPPLARSVAGAVRGALGFDAPPSPGTVGLGDPALLRLDMSGAATAFGVTPPPTRRDRPSGARKRKQTDIEREFARAGH